MRMEGTSAKSVAHLVPREGMRDFKTKQDIGDFILKSLSALAFMLSVKNEKVSQNEKPKSLQPQPKVRINTSPCDLVTLSNINK